MSRPHRTRVLVPTALLVLAGALSACGGTASGTAPSGTAAATSSGDLAAPTTIRVGIAGTSFTGVPASVHPGTVTLDFTNSGSRLHMAAIAHLGDGHTAADIRAFLASPEGRQGPPPWLQLVGGVDELDPGHSASWTGELDAGDYAVLSFSPDAQGVPEVADGLLAPFTAGGDVRRVTVPQTQATVTLDAQNGLTMTALPAGATAIELVNDADAPRTVDVTAVRPGRTYDDVMREAQQGQGVPPSLVRLGGSGVPPHGRVVVGIEPAAAGTTYVVFDIDHVGEGAIAHVTVG